MKNDIKHLFTFSIFFLMLAGFNAKAQTLNCIQGCNDNTFLNSQDPNTIEYDNIVSGFHSTILKESDGTVKVWGERAAPSGTTSVLSPIAVTPANGYTYTGEILKITLGSFGQNNVQYAILTTDGLYMWGSPGTLVHTDVKNTLAFGKVITTVPGTNSFGLPEGVNPEDVKMMFGSYKTLGIVTCSGAAWMLSDFGFKNTNGGYINDGATWTRVQTAANVPLTNVVAMRGSTLAMMALTDNGELYTWGSRTYLGDNTSLNLITTYATKMTLPIVNNTPVTPKMIGISGISSGDSGNSYYLLTTNGALYALGYNFFRQLGDYTSTERRSWVRVKSTNATTDMPDNIAWISPTEHDRSSSSMNALTITGELWSWGNNSAEMLGGGDKSVIYGNRNLLDPTLMTGGLNPSDRIMAVETSGHTTMVIRQCSKKYGYVGHRINGSMGDGSSINAQEPVFNFDDTEEVNLCGAPTAPTVQDIEICLGETADLNTAHIGSTPLGSTLQWWTTPTREPGTQVTTNLGQVPMGTYYAFHQGSCPDPLASKAVHVRLKTDLEITIAVDNETPMIGHEVEFTIRAENTGGSDAGNVRAVVGPPYTLNDYEFVSADAAGYDPATYMWEVGSLTAGEVKILKIRARVKADGDGQYAYYAYGYSEKQECDNTNNHAIITVSPKPNLLITNPMIHQRMK